MSDHMMFDARLFTPWERGSCIYDHYNEKYFKHQLPIVRVGFYKKMAKSEHGFTLRPRGAKYASVIALNSLFKENFVDVLRQTILHEMVHVKLGCEVECREWHGAFDKEMFRLASAGAFRYFW